MEKEFIPYEEAIALKKLGFDEPCFATHNKGLKSPVMWDYWSIELRNSTNEEDEVECTAPTFWAAFKWFRDTYGLIGQPISLSINYPGKVTHYGWDIVSSNSLLNFENEDDGFKEYEEAELECLKKLIELCKKT